MRNRRGVTFEGLHAVLLADHILLQLQLLYMVAHVREVDRDSLALKKVNPFDSDLLKGCFFVFLPPSSLLLQVVFTFISISTSIPRGFI